MHSALNTPPELLDLLDKVAAKASDKWKQVAIQLGIEHGQIHAIEIKKQRRPILCFFEIFYVWRESKASPYTWGTIINALRAPAVEEQQLANELEEWLHTSTAGDSTDTGTCLLFVFDVVISILFL